MTIPNILTCIRAVLVPVFMVLAYQQDPVCQLLALIVYVVACATDFVDGYLARKWHQITDFGKFMDPVADKLTQVVTLWLLASRCAGFRPLTALLLAKEAYMAAWGVFMVRRLGRPLSARWYGKVATAVLFAAVGIHLLWQPGAALSAALIAAAQAGIVGSAALYTARYVRILARGAGYYKCLPADAGKGRSS